MRVGHLFLQPVRPGERHTARIRSTIEKTRLVEEGGFDVAVFAETHFSDHAVSPNPVLLAAAVGQHTDRIDLATGVAVVGLWHPVRLAEDIAMADQLLAGRLEVCVGYGSHPLAFAGLGVPFDERRQRHDEALELLLLAWAGEEFEYHGMHYDVPRPIRVLPDPYRRPHPRITLSASSEASIRAAAATDFKVFGSQSVATSPGAALAMGHAIYLDERRRLRRDGDFWSSSVNRNVAVVDSSRPTEYGRRHADAARRSREAVLRAIELRTASHAYDNGHVPIDPTDVGSSTGADNLIFGTPDEVADQLRNLRDVVGVAEINLITEFGAADERDVCTTIELLGREVLPMIRGDDVAAAATNRDDTAPRTADEEPTSRQ